MTIFWPLFPLWSYLRSFKSLFWLARSIENEKLILSVLSTYVYLNGNARLWNKTCLLYILYIYIFFISFFCFCLSFVLSCFDRLEWKISACWSILAKNYIICMKKCSFIIDILLMLEYCFDRLEWKILGCWSILAKNHIISLKKM